MVSSKMLESEDSNFVLDIGGYTVESMEPSLVDDCMTFVASCLKMQGYYWTFVFYTHSGCY